MSAFNTDMKGWSNVRGYGTISFGSLQNNQITKNNYVWNRLQPLDKPFGVYPPGCEQHGMCQPASETTLAWACQKNVINNNNNDHIFNNVN